MICYSCDFTSASEYYNKSIDYQEQGNTEKELELLEKVLEKNPKFRPALYNRGIINSNSGNYEQAINDYQKIINFDPDNTLVLRNIGNDYANLKKYKKAISYYNKALKTKGAFKSDTLLIELNWINDFDKDSEYYVRKCEIEFERGLAYLDNKEYELAIADFKRTIEVNYEIPTSYYWIGEAYIGLKDSTEICNNFIKSAKLGIEEAKDKLREYCIKKQTD